MHIEAMIFCAAMPLLGFLPQPMVDGRCPGFATSVAGRWAVPLLLAIRAHPGLESFAGGRCGSLITLGLMHPCGIDSRCIVLDIEVLLPCSRTDLLALALSAVGLSGLNFDLAYIAVIMIHDAVSDGSSSSGNNSSDGSSSSCSSSSSRSRSSRQQQQQQQQSQQS